MERFSLLISSLLVFLSSMHNTNCDSDTNSDEIKSLPGLAKQPKFKQYSGYLDATTDGDKKLHYWFAESQNNATTDPLLLWLNGGPGCSSLDGFLSENGPFQVLTGGAGLTPNPYSWNKFANVLYLESPAGVGFSYAVSKNITTGDDITAEENYQALVNFFQKYPQFLQNDFYITGESYAGIYIPTLAVRILNGSQNFTIRGLAIGNGYYSASINLNSIVYFGYQHGIIGHLIWKDLQDECCTPTFCNFYNVSGDCKSQVDRALHFVNDIGLNTYAIYRDCAGGIPKGSTSLKRFLFDWSTITGNNTLLGPKMTSYYRKMEQIPVGSPYHSMYIQKEDTLDCIDTTAETTYLNRADVRKALHIPPTVQNWTVCSEDVKENYTRNYHDMFSQFRLILGQFPILLYNGDTDINCPINSASGFVAGLNLTVTSDWRAWLYQDQVAGFMEEMGTLTLMTVKGAGHMVPQWRPPQAFQMMSNFINGEPQ